EKLEFPVVMKADGLALGKGVIVAADRVAARSAIDEMMSQGRFGDSGRRVVSEDFLRGPECLLHALGDGSNYRLLESSRHDTRAAVTVVLASGRYPGKYETGKTISGLDDAANVEDVQIFHAGTKRVEGEVKTAGGRILAVTALGSTLEAARARAYDAVSRIHFVHCHYRRDIALSVTN